jgi:calcineurin-like phosphoesterase family protein
VNIDRALDERANEAVGPAGWLVHAGDVAWGRAHLEKYASRLKVARVLVAVGNHDDEDDLVAVFGRENVYERFAIKVAGQEAVIDHYPGDSWQASHKACWQLFGHVHGASNTRRKANPSWALSLDVGVDSHGFRPWTWAELVALLRERKQGWLDWRGAMRDKERGGMAPVGKP